jgi:ankyrin repeat protein
MDDLILEMFAHIKANNIKGVKSLLDNGYKVNNMDLGEDTALHIAIDNNRTEIAELLISQPLVNLNLENQWGYTPLMEAISVANLPIFKLLVYNKTVNVNYANGSKQFPLSMLCRNSVVREKLDKLTVYYEMVKLLLDRSDLDINKTIKEGVFNRNLPAVNPLIECIISYNQPVFDLLIDRPDLDINRINYLEVLFFSLYSKQYNIVNIDFDNEGKRIFLHFFDKIINNRYFSDIKYTDINKVMTSPVINLHAKSGDSIISALKIKKQDFDIIEHIVNSLVKKGYNLNKLNELGEGVLTQYLSYISSGHIDNAQVSYEYVELLLKNNVDINSSYNSVVQKTLKLFLDSLIDTDEFKKLVNLYISFGFNVKNKKNYPVLTYLCLEDTRNVINRVEINNVLEFLLQKGFDPNSVNGLINDYFPLALSCNRDDTEKVKILLKYNSNPNIMLQNGESLFKSICLSSHKNLFDLFIDLPNLKIDVSPSEIHLKNFRYNLYTVEEMDDEFNNFIEYDDLDLLLDKRDIITNLEIKNKLKKIRNLNSEKINKILDTILE